MEISYLSSHLLNHLSPHKGRISALNGKKMTSLSHSFIRSYHTRKDLSNNNCDEYHFKSTANFDIGKFRPLKCYNKNKKLFSVRKPLQAELNDEDEKKAGDNKGLLKTKEGVEQVLHMVGGTGEISYAKNSRIQSKGIMKAKPIVEEAVKEIYRTLTPNKFVAVDMACSSGPNTFLVIYEITNTIDKLSRELGHSAPEIQFFLNDLPGNDFNNIFRSLTDFERQIREEDSKFLPFYVAGLPGSFYTRLFPSKSVHFFHSSYGQMWLSKVPGGVNGKSALTEGLYMEQFKEDFTTFLKLRSKELISGGRMVLTISGSRKNPEYKDMAFIWGLLTVALNDMISEGLLQEWQRKATNFPFHTPTMEEIKSIIEADGSFDLQKLQTFELSWDPFEEITDNIASDYVLKGKTVANYIRAAAEPMLQHHFDGKIIEELFSRYAKIIADHLKEKPKWLSIILDLKLKE